jgi:hypothetical protein
VRHARLTALVGKRFRPGPIVVAEREFCGPCRQSGRRQFGRDRRNQYGNSCAVRRCGRLLSSQDRTAARARMAFSTVELKQIERLVGPLCRRRSSTRTVARGRLAYDVTGHRVVVVEARPIWNEPTADWSRHPVAKLAFVRKTGLWYLLWPRTARKWTRYGPLPCSSELRDLVAQIDSDPHCCFFG